MKYMNLFVIFTILIINTCYALTCEEAEDIFDIDFQENCCDLQYITCDATNENILSIDALELEEKKKNENKISESEEEGMRRLFARKKKKHHNNYFDDDDEQYNCTVLINGTAVNITTSEDICSNATSVQFSSIFCIIIAILAAIFMF